MSAYWIAHVTIHDMEQYKQYMATAPQAFQKYGAKFLARGGASEVLEDKSLNVTWSLNFQTWKLHVNVIFHLNISLPKVNAKAAVMSW